MAGWIKLHRSIAKSSISDNPECFAVWVHLLISATHKEHKQVVGKQVITLKPGQLVYGRAKFSAKTGLSEMKLRRILSILESLGQVSIKSTNKYSIISITNWDQYQSDNQQIANKEPTDNQQTTTNKNVENGEKLNNGSLPASPAVPCAEIVDLFNRSFDELPKVKILSDKRKQLIKRRWAENPSMQNLDAWGKLFEHIRKSDFLMGRTAHKPWHGLCFDWIFNGTNFIKIVEGNYDNVN